jgi:Calx-beta domain-containing protein
MKHRTIATLLISLLILSFMIWSFGSSAANPNEPLAEKDSLPENANESSEIFQEGRERESDADLGKFGSRVNREEYLRARAEYLGLRRGFEAGRPFNPDLRRRAIDQMERQETNRRLESIVNGGISPAAGGAWTAIGPAPLPNGVGSNSGPTSGRVTSIAIDPTNPNKIYLGTAQGGVWRSLDAGVNWTAIFDSAESLAIGALAVAPSNPSILYVGTGEFNSCGDCFFGVGLYRIDNVDTAPSLVGPINPQQTISNFTYKVFNGRSITKILVHPTDAATIFVSTGNGVGGSGANSLGQVPTLATRGVYRSTDATSAAPSFTKLVVTTDSSPDSPATGNVTISDMVMEPGNPDHILAGVLGVGAGVANSSGVYESTNALAATPTFTQRLFLPLLNLAGIRVQLAINKVGAVITAYAATSEAPNNTPGCNSTTSGTGAVRKSTDGGTTWSGQLTGGGGFCSGQCFYDMPVAVDPNDVNLVYIGGQVSSTCGGVTRKATDGGNGAVGNSFAGDSSGLHADNHALVFDGAGNIYCGNDGGIWKRSATAAAGSAWTNLNNAPLNTLQFESIAVHPTDQFLMIGGTQDNGTEYQITSSENWRRAEGGDGGYALIDQSATDTTDVTMYHTFFNRAGVQIGFDRIFKSACLPDFDSWPARGEFGGSVIPTPVPCDGGTPLYQHNGLQLTDAVLFYAPMALGPGAPNTVYFGSDRLYRSSDRGDTMTIVSQASLSNPGGNGSPISSIAIWRGGDNIRMVGLQNGQVWATSTGSSTMVNLASPAPPNPNLSTNKFIGRAMIDPNNKNVAYIALSYYAPAGQGVWKISNLAAASGTSPAAPVWTAAGNGIPSIPINAFAIDPLNSNNLYAGTDIGVYFSSDGGANWSPFGTGLPRSAVFDLQIQPSFRILRAATHGRGIWETPLLSPAGSTVQFTAASSSVTEGQLSTPVTITRSGDFSFPASVNYSTGDSSGANGCGTNTGAASARCDYIATSGTLNFAANENSKTILIPIWSDSYATEGDETFNVTLTGASGNNVSLGSPSTIVITIGESAFSGANQIDSTNFYVREQYIDFLNREPDTNGFNFWVNNIDSCGADVGCREVRRIDSSAAFFISIEFQGTGYLVERIYKASFGDTTGTSSTGGVHNVTVPIIRLNEFLPDTQRIGQGVVVRVGNWEQQLEDNKQTFTEEFVQRSRFLTALPPSLTPTQFVNALNTNAGNPLSPAESTQLISDLTAGTRTRAQVLRAVAEDADLVTAEFNRAFVLMQYFGYLRRNPNDPQDSDYAGFEFWLNKLNQFNGNYINAEMVKAFTSSIEYRKRFAQ